MRLLLLLLLLGCPEEPAEEVPCERVGTASILDGWEPRFSGALSSPQAGDAYLANDLVHEFDPKDADARHAAMVTMCRCGDLKFEDAEHEITSAIKLKCKSLANELSSGIVDQADQDQAIKSLVNAGASWYQANKYLIEAKEGLHIDKAHLTHSRDYGVETIALNRERRHQYIPIKEWWESTGSSGGCCGSRVKLMFESMSDPEQPRAA